MQLDRIPHPLRVPRQWICWKFEHREGSLKPAKVPYSPTWECKAKVTDPNTWASFVEARTAFERGGYDGIGFVFTANDPFAGIDFDDTEDDAELLTWHEDVHRKLDTYSELSPSGKGLHAIVEASVVRGCRGSKLEIYSDLRFFTMTGDVINDAPIAERQDMVETLAALIRPVTASANSDSDEPETVDDDGIRNMMFAAANGEKARDLYEGQWKKHFPNSEGPSEADFALIDIIAYYSPNRAQIARIFRASALGQRDKARREDYIKPMLASAFDNRVPKIDISAAIDAAKAMIEATIAAKAIGLPVLERVPDDGVPTFDVGNLEGQSVKPRDWLVEGMIPLGAVSIVNGDGGGGKSTIAGQLCAAKVLGRSWLGSNPLPKGRALFITAEDDAAEVHRRMVDIVKAEGVSMRDLAGLHVMPLADRDALLAVPGRARGPLEPTPLYAALAARVATIRPDVTVIDTLADTFGGNEIDRAQARQFIAMLRRLAIEFQTAIVVLAHPSQSGMTSGSGTSGSTGWSNSVRSRLYLKRVEHKPNLRTLELMKSNYGAIGKQITLRWEHGVFWPIGSADSADAHVRESEQSVDGLFLEIMADFTVRGQDLSRSHNSKDYAPKLFQTHPKAGGTNKLGFAGAMNRLFAQGRIVETNVGFASKSKAVLVLAEAASGFSNSPSGSVPGCSNSPANSPSGLFELPCEVTSEQPP